MENNKDEKIISSGIKSTGGMNGMEVVINAGQKGENKTAQKTEEKTEPAAGERAQTAIAELRNMYSEKLREHYDRSAEKLRAERDEALREKWILQQRAKAALSEQLAAKGINGGATESAAANIDAQYQGDRNDVREDYSDGILELSEEYGNKVFDAEKDFGEKWIDYLLSLGVLEEKQKDSLELKGRS